MEKYIIIKDKVKVRNPCFEQNNIYEGSIDNFSFNDKNRSINQLKKNF